MKAFARAWLSLVIASFLMLPSAYADDAGFTGKYVVEFRARTLAGESWRSSERYGPVGHAFLLLGREYANGEIRFYKAGGFYPAAGSPLKYIGAPGTIDYRVDKDIGPFRSYRVDITEEQALHIEYMMKNWEHRPYVIVAQDCVSFLSDVASNIGLKTPNILTSPAIENIHPELYIIELSNLNGGASKADVREADAARIKTKRDQSSKTQAKVAKKIREREALPSVREPPPEFFEPYPVPTPDDFDAYMTPLIK